MYRRDYLQAVSLLTLGGVSAVAGCSAAGATTPAGNAEEAPMLPTEPDYGDWFEGVSNYDGTVDLRGATPVTVRVGDKGNLGAFGFGPAAVALSPGTTVVWEWTGKGGGHNVVADDGAFTSGPLVDAAGHTFEARFDHSGISRYVCEPHRAMGMRGAVVVMGGEPGT